MSKEPDLMLAALKRLAHTPPLASMADQADALLADIIAEVAASNQHAREGDGEGVLVHGLKIQAMVDATDRNGLAALAMRAVAALVHEFERQGSTEETATV